ncbi:MAG: hypothetical protein KJ882_00805 [Proteobacteria bacterium]|nr:hypothetical protein [Pseudomonadota bacterium]
MSNINKMYFILIIVVSALLFPAKAFANSMGPILPLVSIFGWFAMPLIVIIEGLYYKDKKIIKPFKLSLIANLRSGVVGIFLGLIGFPLMAGPLIEEPRMNLFTMSMVFIVLGTVLHWWISCKVESAYALKLDSDIEPKALKSIIYRANSITYVLICAYIVIENLEYL